MPRNGNWHTKSHKNPVRIPVAASKDNAMPLEWIQQAKEVHKEFGRDGLLKFMRKSEEMDEVAPNSLNVLLPLFGEKE